MMETAQVKQEPGKAFRAAIMLASIIAITACKAWDKAPEGRCTLADTRIPLITERFDAGDDPKKDDPPDPVS